MRISAGQRFGLLTTVSIAGSAAASHLLWRCRCDCGAFVDRKTNNLRAKSLSSCGCVRSALAETHGMRGTSTYQSWQGAKARCHNQKSKDFHRYGGRGIQMCVRWRDSFENFHADMGDKPDGTSLERINVDGDYEPMNCKWATAVEQARNRRRSVYLDWGGRRQHLSDVADLLGITYGAAFMRLQRGKLHDCA